jgi:hypothetical protein
LLLELEMRQQIGGEVVQCIDHPRAGGHPFSHQKGVRVCFDLVQEMRHLPVIGLKPVYHRARFGLRTTDSREERHILNSMVGMHNPAIIQTIDPQFPERTAGPE